MAWPPCSPAGRARPIDQMDATLGSYAKAIAEDFPELRPTASRFKALQLLWTPTPTRTRSRRWHDHAPVGPPLCPRVRRHGGTAQRGHRPPRGPRSRHRGVGREPSARTAASRSSPSSTSRAWPRSTRTRYPTTSGGRAHPDAGRHLSLRNQPGSSQAGRPHRPWRADGPPGQSGIGNYGPMTTPTTGSRRTVGGRSSNPSRGSTCGVTRSARPISSTTPAPRLPKPEAALPLVVEIYRALPHAELDWAV